MLMYVNCNSRYLRLQKPWVSQSIRNVCNFFALTDNLHSKKKKVFTIKHPLFSSAEHHRHNQSNQTQYCIHSYHQNNGPTNKIIFNNQFLGAFVIFLKATVSFVMSVSPSAWNDLVSTERIFMKFDIWVRFENLSRKFSFINIGQEQRALHMKLNIISWS